MKIVDNGRYIDIYGGLREVYKTVATLSYTEYLSEETRQVLLKLDLLLDKINPKDGKIYIGYRLRNIILDHMYLVDRLKDMSIGSFDYEGLGEYGITMDKIKGVIKERRTELMRLCKKKNNASDYIYLVHKLNIIIL